MEIQSQNLISGLQITRWLALTNVTVRKFLVHRILAGRSADPQITYQWPFQTPSAGRHVLHIKCILGLENTYRQRLKVFTSTASVDGFDRRAMTPALNERLAKIVQKMFDMTQPNIYY